jgi:hypothetical protein
MAWDDSDTSDSDTVPHDEQNDVVSAGASQSEMKQEPPFPKLTKAQMKTNKEVEREVRKEATKKAKAAAMAGRPVTVKKKTLTCEVLKKYGACAKGDTCRFLHEKSTQPMSQPGWKSEERPSDDKCIKKLYPVPPFCAPCRLAGTLAGSPSPLCRHWNLHAWPIVRSSYSLTTHLWGRRTYPTVFH